MVNSGNTNEATPLAFLALSAEAESNSSIII
jgi:hypothetical protein